MKNFIQLQFPFMQDLLTPLEKIGILIELQDREEIRQIETEFWRRYFLDNPTRSV